MDKVEVFSCEGKRLNRNTRKGGREFRAKLAKEEGV